jgi:hypothetical protein
MRSCILLFLIFLFYNNGNCQVVGFEKITSKDSLRIDFSALYDVHSTAIRNEISRKLFRGGEITDENKTTILNQHKKLNRMGQEIRGDFSFVNLKSTVFKTKKYAWMYNIGYHSMFSGNYSKDMMQLALYGNSQSLGDTLHFNGSKFQHINYQFAGIGLMDKMSKSYLTLNVVNLQTQFAANLDGDFYSSSDSSSVYLRTNGDLNTTYKSKISNGIGLSLNFTLNIKVPLFEHKNTYFQIKVLDFGVVRMNSVNSYKVDTTLNYNGFDVNDLLHFQQVSLDKNIWMDTLNVKNDTLAKWAVLPVMLQFSKIIVFDSTARFQTFFGVKTYPSLSYFPKFFAGVDLKLNKYIFSGISLTYGGFGGFRAGIYTRIDYKKIAFHIGTEDFYGFVSKKGFGQNVNLRFLCEF